MAPSVRFGSSGPFPFSPGGRASESRWVAASWGASRGGRRRRARSERGGGRERPAGFLRSRGAGLARVSTRGRVSAGRAGRVGNNFPLAPAPGIRGQAPLSPYFLPGSPRPGRQGNPEKRRRRRRQPRGGGEKRARRGRRRDARSDSGSGSGRLGAAGSDAPHTHSRARGRGPAAALGRLLFLVPLSFLLFLLLLAAAAAAPGAGRRGYCLRARAEAGGPGRAGSRAALAPFSPPPSLPLGRRPRARRELRPRVVPGAAASSSGAESPRGAEPASRAAAPQSPKRETAPAASEEKTGEGRERERGRLTLQVPEEDGERKGHGGRGWWKRNKEDLLFMKCLIQHFSSRKGGHMIPI